MNLCVVHFTSSLANWQKIEYTMVFSEISFIFRHILALLFKPIHNKMTAPLINAFMKMYFCIFQMYNIYFVMDVSININNIVNYTLK